MSHSDGMNQDLHACYQIHNTQIVYCVCVSLSNCMAIEFSNSFILAVIYLTITKVKSIHRIIIGKLNNVSVLLQGFSGRTK